MLDIIWEKDPAGHQEGNYRRSAIIDYVDSIYTRDSNNQKSINECCFFFARAITTNYSKQQQIRSMSTFETKDMTIS